MTVHNFFLVQKWRPWIIWKCPNLGQGVQISGNLPYLIFFSNSNFRIKGQSVILIVHRDIIDFLISLWESNSAAWKIVTLLLKIYYLICCLYPIWWPSPAPSWQRSRAWRYHIQDILRSLMNLVEQDIANHQSVYRGGLGFPAVYRYYQCTGIPLQKGSV